MADVIDMNTNKVTADIVLEVRKDVASDRHDCSCDELAASEIGRVTDARESALALYTPSESIPVRRRKPAKRNVYVRISSLLHIVSAARTIPNCRVAGTISAVSELSVVTLEEPPAQRRQAYRYLRVSHRRVSSILRRRAQRRD